jgi:hypothetical protein
MSIPKALFNESRIMEDPKNLLASLTDSIDQLLESDAQVVPPHLSSDIDPLAGQWSDADFPLLLGRFYVEGRTGRLFVRNAEYEKSIFFEAGFPVMATSNDYADRMLEMLFSEQVLTHQQKTEVERIIDATERRAGAVLLELGILRPDDLLPTVRRHYEHILFSLFSWTTGQWKIEEGATADSDRIRCLRHPVELLLEGLALGYPQEKIATKIGTGTEIYKLDQTRIAIDLLQHFSGQPAGQRIPLLFDGVRTFDEVVTASGLSKSMVERIAFSLLCFSVLHKHGFNPLATLSAWPVSHDLSLERKCIQEAYLLANESDYYTVLAIDRNASTPDIQNALARSLASISYPSLSMETLQLHHEKIEEIREVFIEAARVLTSQTLRRSYEFNLLHGPDADQVFDSSPKSDEIPSL